MPRRPTFAAFDQGQKPQIALINAATTDLRVDFGRLASALQEYVDRHVAPVWSTPANVVVPPDKRIPAGHWAVVLLDNADVKGALGYHDLTPEGLPMSKVFVRQTIAAKEQLSVTASHEVAEMLVDPAIQMGAVAPNGTWYAYEICDAVQSQAFAVQGLAMSNFQYPSWFEAFHAQPRKRDHLGKCPRAFNIQKGGYMPVFRQGRWTQIFGGTAKEQAAAEKRFHLSHHPRTFLRTNGRDETGQLCLVCSAVECGAGNLNVSGVC